jgi:hypothetical protein
MRDQLGYLIEVAMRPSVSIQVVPVRVGAHSGMNGPFVIMDYAAMPQPGAPGEQGGQPLSGGAEGCRGL